MMRTHAAVKKVVVVNGRTNELELVEAALDAGHYDVVFVESTEHAYSQIKRVQPNLVILCLRIEDPEGFNVLSMLKLDRDTRGIPVLTYTTDYEGAESDTEPTGLPDDDIVETLPALQMN